jgi:hypothetical protein
VLSALLPCWCAGVHPAPMHPARPWQSTLLPTAPQVMRRAHWDEEREVWVLERLSDVGRRDGGSGFKRPVSAAGARRPVTDFAKAVAAAGDMNPRFRSENILSLELDLPERTTADFEAGVPEAQVQVGTCAACAGLYWPVLACRADWCM